MKQKLLLALALLLFVILFIPGLMITGYVRLRLKG